MNSYEQLVESFQKCGLSRTAAEQAAAGRGVSVAEARRRAEETDQAAPAAAPTNFDQRVARFQGQGLSLRAAEIAATGGGSLSEVHQREQDRLSLTESGRPATPLREAVDRAQAASLARIGKATSKSASPVVKLREVEGRPQTDMLGRPVSPITGRAYPIREAMRARYAR